MIAEVAVAMYMKTGFLKPAHDSDERVYLP
jgi:hypothetical protein